MRIRGDGTPRIMDIVAMVVTVGKKTIEGVQYFAQNDNELWDGVSGNVQCCPTSNAALLNFLRPGLAASAKAAGFKEFESYYKANFDLLGYTADDRGNHDDHTVVLREAFGIESTWRTDLTWADVVRSIDADIPVVCGLDYKSSGHIVLIVGYTEDGFLINDPYGIRDGVADEYLEVNPGYGDRSGEHDFYSKTSLEQLFFCGSGGWGRWVTAVEQKPTGL